MDLQQLKAEVQKANAELAKFNAQALKTATGVRVVEQATDQAGKATGGFFKQLLGANIAANVITNALYRVKDGLVNFAKGSIQASSSLTELDSKARVVFGKDFPAVSKEVARIAQEVGRSSSAILQYAADMGAVIQASGLTSKSVQTMSTDFAKLAVDLASFHNTTDIEAFNALRSAVTGELEPLKRYGVVMTQANLQAFALTKGIKQKIETMNQGQQTAIRYAYIMDRTSVAQGDAARTAGSLANQTRRLQGEWRTFQETIGEDITPFLANSLGLLNDWLLRILGTISVVKQSWADFFELTGQQLKGTRAEKLYDYFTGPQKQLDALNPFHGVSDTDMKEFFGPAGSTKSFGELERQKKIDDAIKTAREAGGGGGKDGADALKKAIDKMEQAEKDILQAMEEQAKLNKDRIDEYKEELELRKKLGFLMPKEEAMLERLNRRAEYQTQAVEDATKAWQEQADALKEVEDKIADINKQIKDEQADLQKTLASIDKETGRSKEEKAADLYRDLKELDDKLARGEGNSPEDLAKRAQLEGSLGRLDPSLRKSGQEIAGLDPFQEIDRQSERKKQDAREESDARIAGLKAELAEAQSNRDGIIALEAQKKEAVIQALRERENQTTGHYQLENDKLRTFVATQVAEYDKLAASIRGPTPVRKATGGYISGPGGPTDDRIHALLSDGEYVINAASTKMFRPLLDKINFGSMPRFATGGPVTNSDSHNISVSIANHGDAARLHADPRMLRWTLRKLL